MKIGDRVYYRNEPVWIIGYRSARFREDHAWVLVEWANGERRYVPANTLAPDPKAETPR